jgi:uncharacterized surface protein with fasciclin (FAS1) repeats
MKTLVATIAVLGLAFGLGCEQQQKPASEAAPAATAPVEHASNLPPLSPNNIVSLALASEDHTTLVAALQAADYVTAVAASGPLTVFAPTNAAFEALPPGTLDDLMKPENGDQLREILKYHVTTSALSADSFRDGQTLGMANGAKATLAVSDDGVAINGANVVASVRAENGMLHIVDAVLLPPSD